MIKLYGISKLDKLEKKIRNKKIIIGVIGLGYVGLPLAVEFAKVGIKTIGFDVDKNKIDKIIKNDNYIPDIDNKDFYNVINKKYFTATDDFSQLQNVDVIFICVPTPFKKAKTPDVSYIRIASEDVAKYLRRGQLIVLQSTTYPGTTEELVKPILERRGLKEGKDFYLAFSPERIDPGNKNFNAKNTPKVVGGFSQKGTDCVCEIFSSIIDKKHIYKVSSPSSAEMTKLLENIFRSVNIALVNELKMLCHRMGIDIWEVIDAASTKPFGFMPFYPGPGVGGHCIPVDPYYLSWKAREYDFWTNFIELAAEVNSGMPLYVVNRIMDILHNNGKNLSKIKLLQLGVTFKKDINDVRNSPAIHVLEILKEKRFNVSFNDPYVSSIDINIGRYNGTKKKETIRRIELNKSVLRKYDAVIIAVGHNKYDYNWIVKNSSLVFDTVNATRNVNNGREKIIRV